jgi:hypothetical protein
MAVARSPKPAAFYRIMTRKIYLSLIFILMICVGAVWAEILGVTDDPLVIGGGARPLGMGRAFGAVANDSDAIFINPAGAASLKEPQAMAMFTSLLGGTVYYSEYCGTLPADFGSLGIGYITTGVNDIIIGTSEIGTDYYDSVLAFNYASPLSRFFRYGENVLLGLNLKIFSRGFTGATNESSSGFSSDFGIKYVASPYLNFGIVRQNFIPVSLGAGIHTSGGEEALAGVTKLSIAVKPVPWEGQAVLAGDLDIPAQSGSPTTAHFGAEWKTSPNLFLRCGLDESVDSAAPGGTSWNPTIGTSLIYAGFRMDYAYHPYYNDPALAVSYVSLSYSGEQWLTLRGRTD